MNDMILIIGLHPLTNFVEEKYRENGKMVTAIETYQNSIDVDMFEEVCIMMDGKNKDTADAESLSAVASIAEKKTNNKIITCHLLLHSNQTLQLLQKEDWNECIRSKMDIYPFTTDQIWTNTIRVDWKPVCLSSEYVPHVVIFGNSQMAEMVASNIAHTAHFPNYIKNHNLRTRITIVDDNAEEIMKRWTSHFKHLLDNSYYRLVDARQNPKVLFFHEPIYANSREDFVDVEWEFVKASPYDYPVRNKLQIWAADTSRQLLTVVMAYERQINNINNAVNLPDALFNLDIPIYVYMKDDSNYSLLNKQGKLGKIIPFGMIDKGYDVRMPFIAMAKNVNYIYDLCYNENIAIDHNQLYKKEQNLRFAVDIDKKKRDELWRKLSNVKRLSNLYNAVTVPVKMRSLGIEENEWEKFYDLSQPQINIMAEVEHNRWVLEELMLGWRPCDDQETKEVEQNIEMKEILKKQKIHYDIRAYNDLRTDVTGQNVRLYDICLCAALPLITNTFAEEIK